MGRLNRFDQHRYIGTRDDMVLYDCDDVDQLATLEQRMADDELLRRNLIQSFAPDTVAEANNRGFRARTREHRNT